jgi:hypothetical protein
VGKSFGK